MNTNSTELSLLPATQLPSLRIAYKNSEVVEQKTTAANPQSSAKKSTIKPSVKQQLPLFDDHKFKAKDYDPL
jgi:hypothetical protein